MCVCVCVCVCVFVFVLSQVNKTLPCGSITSVIISRNHNSSCIRKLLEATVNTVLSVCSSEDVTAYSALLHLFYGKFFSAILRKYFFEDGINQDFCSAEFSFSTSLTEIK